MGGAVAVLGGLVTFTNCTFATNLCLGGPGGLGGTGAGCNSGRGNGGDGGGGGLGGVARGGALFRSGGQVGVSFSTFASNGALGGMGGLGGAGGEGCSGAFDGASGVHGVEGLSFGGALFASADLPLLRLAGSILAHNMDGLNCSGPIRDDRNNLSTDTSCDFGPPSPIDPRLGPFALQGGSVPTVALLADSPAIDAVQAGAQRDSPCPAQDARGVARGRTCDIGAFEFVPVAVSASAQGSGVRLEFLAAPGVSCGLESSTDLRAWTEIDQGQCDSLGRVVFVIQSQAGSRFFRLGILPQAVSAEKD